MHISYFTERPYRYVPNDMVIQNGFFGNPNKYFDPVKGGQLLNEYLDEKLLAEEVGFDGIMLNEHHDTSFCMGSVMNVEASVLARITKKVKIALLGNPLPIVGNPLRLAEELAMIDMISGGRLVSGWVRGGGSEQFASNANPAFNREYFNEAHEVVIKAWTAARSDSLRGQAFPLPLHRSLGAAGSETASADLDSRTAESRDRRMVRGTPLSLRRAGHVPAAHRRLVGLLSRRGGQAGLPGRHRELRLPAEGLRGRNRGEGARDRQVRHVRRSRDRLQPVRPAAMDVPAGVQLEAGDQAHRAAVHARPMRPQGSPWATVARHTVGNRQTRQNISDAQVEHRSGIWGESPRQTSNRRASTSSARSPTWRSNSR